MLSVSHLSPLSLAVFPLRTPRLQFSFPGPAQTVSVCRGSCWVFGLFGHCALGLLLQKRISASNYMGEGLLTLFYQQPSEVSGMSGTGDGVLSNKTSRLQVLSHSVQQGSSQTSVGKSCFERQIDILTPKIIQWSRKSLGI